MPGIIETTSFETIEVKELHPTFAAEVAGVDFQDVPEKQFTEIIAAMAKVCFLKSVLITARHSLTRDCSTVSVCSGTRA